MPYVKPNQQKWLLSFLNLGLASARDFRLEAGDLNFLVTKLVLWWLGDQPTYAYFNAAIGALECAKLELYRRMVARYEDVKRAENGDVYPFMDDQGRVQPREAE